MHEAYQAHKNNVAQALDDMYNGKPVKAQLGLLAKIEFQWGNEEVEITFDDDEFNSFVKDY